MSNQISEVLKDLSERRSVIDQALRDGSVSSKVLTENYAYVYKAEENKIGMGRSGSADLTESGDDYILFTVSTLEEDRDGDIVVPMGCKLHNFVKNPVWFFGHQQWEIPIGISKGPDGILHCYPEQQRVRERFYPDKADEDAMFIFGKVQRGILNATSIAFVPISARRREDVRKGHQHEGGAGGWIFDEWDKTETSIVGVPSNAAATVEQRSLQGALRDALDKEKQFIRPRLQKALQAYCAKSTNESGGCWTGWCPTCPPVKKSDAGGWKTGDAPSSKSLAKGCGCSAACACKSKVKKSMIDDFPTEGDEVFHAMSGREGMILTVTGTSVTIGWEDGQKNTVDATRLMPGNGRWTLKALRKGTVIKMKIAGHDYVPPFTTFQADEDEAPEPSMAGKWFIVDSNEMTLPRGQGGPFNSRGEAEAKIRQFMQQKSRRDRMRKASESYKVVRNESNGSPMTTADYDMPGPEKEIFFVCRESGDSVNKNGQDNEMADMRLGFDFWTSRAEAQAVANKLNAKKSLRRKSIRKEMDIEYDQGYVAAWDGRPRSTNPYRTRAQDADAAADWDAGWVDGAKERLQGRKSHRRRKSMDQSSGAAGGYMVPEESKAETRFSRGNEVQTPRGPGMIVAVKIDEYDMPKYTVELENGSKAEFRGGDLQRKSLRPRKSGYAVPEESKANNELKVGDSVTFIKYVAGTAGATSGEVTYMTEDGVVIVKLSNGKRIETTADCLSKRDTKSAHRCTFCKGSGSGCGRKGDCPDCDGRGVVRAKSLMRKAIQAGDRVQLKNGAVGTVIKPSAKQQGQEAQDAGHFMWDVKIEENGSMPYGVKGQVLSVSQAVMRKKSLVRKGMVEDILNLYQRAGAVREPSEVKPLFDEAVALVANAKPSDLKAAWKRMNGHTNLSGDALRREIPAAIRLRGGNKMRVQVSLRGGVKKRHVRKDFDEVEAVEQPPHEVALAHMYQTARSALDGMTPFDPQTGEENKLHKAMTEHCDTLKAMWGEYGAKGEDGEAKDLDEMIKGMETSGPGKSEIGEANLVDDGIIPEDVEAELDDEVEMSADDEVQMELDDDVQMDDDSAVEMEEADDVQKAGGKDWPIGNGHGADRKGTEQEFRAQLKKEGWEQELIDFCVARRIYPNYQRVVDKFRAEFGRMPGEAKSADDFDQLEKDFDDMIEAEKSEIGSEEWLDEEAAELEHQEMDLSPAMDSVLEDDQAVQLKSDFDEEFAEDDMVQKADAPVASTKIKRDGDEFIVEAYDADGKRMPNSDYYTDDRADAQATARAMVNPRKSEDDSVEKSEFDEELVEGEESPSEVIDDPDVDEILERYDTKQKMLARDGRVGEFYTIVAANGLAGDYIGQTGKVIRNSGGELEMQFPNGKKVLVRPGSQIETEKGWHTRKAGRARVRKVLAAGGRIKRGQDGRKWLVLPMVKKSQVRKGASSTVVISDDGIGYLMDACADNDCEYEVLPDKLPDGKHKVRIYGDQSSAVLATANAVRGKAFKKSAPPKLLSKARPGETVSDFAARHGVDNIGGKWFVLDEHRQKVSTPCDTLDQATKLIASAKQVMKSATTDPVVKSLFADLARERQLLDLAKSRCGINGN